MLADKIRKILNMFASVQGKLSPQNEANKRAYEKIDATFTRLEPSLRKNQHDCTNKRITGQESVSLRHIACIASWLMHRMFVPICGLQTIQKSPQYASTSSALMMMRLALCSDCSWTRCSSRIRSSWSFFTFSTLDSFSCCCVDKKMSRV